MKLHHLSSLLIIMIFGLQTNAQENNIKVYDVAQEESRAKFEALDLDKNHPNLLNPDISKNEIDKVIGSWTELHQDIAKYLKTNDFEWGVEDPEVMLLHKFYFEPDGKIKTYFFRVFNEEVSDARREEYSKLITEFVRTHRIAITQDFQFAQCGKTKYINP